MLRTLGNCLRCSRKQAYQVEVKSARHDGRLKDHPDAVYGAIVARLQEFKEGLLEKQQRLNGEWKVLARGKKSALEFRPILESLVSEMELSGMGKSYRDLLLGYLARIPPAHRSDVRKDRRGYTSVDGSTSAPRGAGACREAHRLVVEL
ncbi:hypothetical protein N9L68_00470, partial [bacterium]|nr:hypothetical protein [bacterium]